MTSINNFLEDAENEYNSWRNSSKYSQDKQEYLKNVSEEVRDIALMVWKEEDYFIRWYMNEKIEKLGNKTPYEYVKLNGTKEVKRLINGLISPPFT